MSFDPSAALAILGNGPALVTFTKKDGTERTMRCTRSPDLLPADAITGNDRRKDQGNLIAVYDLDDRKWKGFFFHNLIAIQPIA